MTERHYQDEQQRSFSRPTNEDPETGGGKLIPGIFKTVIKSLISVALESNFRS